MKLKIKLIVLAVQLVLLALIVLLFEMYEPIVDLYSNVIFYPFENVRSFILNFVPFSMGDIFYIMGGLAIFFTLLRWAYFIAKFNLRKGKLLSSFINCLNSLSFIVLFFLLGWGGNYYKDPLAETWEMTAGKNRKEDSVALVAFNQYLVKQLNEKSSYYTAYSDKNVNDLSRLWYNDFTNSKLGSEGFHIKTSLFSSALDYLGIDGYYNPFTGEGQINEQLPAFMKPFVYCHEMAHQTGIAAENDANLLAYAVCKTTLEPTFNYSADLNMWLLANHKLFRKDSNLAKSFKDNLNPLTKLQLDTLAKLSKKYNNPLARTGSQFYDSYLKANHQKDGIKSYGNSILFAWQFTQRKPTKAKQSIKIP